jgi:hypothetical protein
MTVSSTTNRKTYAGNGVTTSFATSPLVFFASGDLEVYVVTTDTGAATLLVENSNYTVSGGAGSAGTVNLAAGASPYGAPSASQTLVIRRALSYLQDDDFVNGDINDAEVVEQRFDKITMMLQQIAENGDRSLSLAIADVSGAEVTLPLPEANALIGWNAAGNGLANYASPEAASLGEARRCPQNAQNGNYTLALTDAGHHIYSKNTGAQTITIPANSSVAFDTGAIITIVNNGTTAITIEDGTTTLKLAGTTSTGNRTVAIGGMATLLNVEDDVWFVSGAGLS